MPIATGWHLVCLLALLAVGCEQKQAASTMPWTARVDSARLSENEFVEIYAQAVREGVPGTTVSITGVRELTIKFPGGWEAKAFLDNLWRDVSTVKTGRVDICHRYIASLRSLERNRDAANSSIATNRIVAVIRDQAFFDETVRMGGGSNSLVSDKLVADLLVLYVSDRDGGMAYLTEADLKETGIPRENLRPLALDNLRTVLPPVKRAGGGPIFMLTCDGNYESSLLLFDKIWESQTNSVSGDIIAAIPARDMLVFTGSNSKEGLKAVREIAESTFKKGARPISSKLLVRRNGKWEIFVK